MGIRANGCRLNRTRSRSSALTSEQDCLLYLHRSPLPGVLNPAQPFISLSPTDPSLGITPLVAQDTPTISQTPHYEVIKMSEDSLESLTVLRI